MKRKILVVAVAAFAGLSMLAQEKKEAPKKAPAMGGILHPEMTVENGTYDKPMATHRHQARSAVDHHHGGRRRGQQAAAGRPITRVGEIVDFSCYLQLGKHGEKHRACGQKCVNNGQPIGLLTKDGALYMLMPEEHDPRRDGGVDAQSRPPSTWATSWKVNGTAAR